VFERRKNEVFLKWTKNREREIERDNIRR